MPITFRCSGCAQMYRVPDEAAGRASRCKKCNTSMTIPDGDTGITQKPLPIPVRKSKVVPDLPPDEDEPRRPRRKKKNSSALMFALMGVGFLMLGCAITSAAGAGAWWYFAESGGDCMKYLPNNCEMIVSLRMDKMMDSPVYRQIKKENPDINQKWNVNTEDSPFEPDDIEQLLIGAGSSVNEAVVVVKSKKTIDANEVVAKWKKRNRKYTESKVGKYTLYELEAQPLPQFAAGGGFVNQPAASSRTEAFCIPESKIMIAGQANAVRAVLQRDKKPDLSPGLQSAMKHVDLSKPVAVAVNYKAYSKSNAQNMNLPGLKFDNLGFDKVEGMAFQVDLSSDVQLSMTLICTDKTSAEDLSTKMNGLLALGKPQMAQNLGSEGMEVLNSIKLKNQNNLVVGSMTIKASQVSKGVGNMPATGVPGGAPRR